MKKIFSLAAILFAAMSLNAQESITCAEAVTLMPAQSGSETEAVYTVTGYVTNTNGAISPSRTDASKETATCDRLQNANTETANRHNCRVSDAGKNNGSSSATMPMNSF